MLRKFLGVIIVMITVFLFSCKKNADNNSAAIIGNWRYTNSTVDSLLNGNWTSPVTVYDSTIVDNLAESLQFTATDTVYYTYRGITTWSNYKIDGNNLILIGSAGNDQLTIHSLTSTNLQLEVYSSGNYHNWANFTKY